MAVTCLFKGLAAPEGPVVLPDGDIACVEMASSVASVTRIASGHRSVVVHTGGRPNGLAIDGKGGFWVAGGPTRAVGRFDPDGRYLGAIEDSERPFLFPNDLAFGPDGALYMTDSGWLAEDLGAGGAPRADIRTLAYDGAVIRIDPASGESRPIVRGLRFANGLAFAPDGALYVNESMSGAILRVAADGTTTSYADVLDGCGADVFGPDGMAFAADGTLYCAVFGAGHIAVVPPGGGRVVARIETPGRAPTNVAFARDGSPVIFVTEVERGELLRIDVDRPGLPLHELTIT